MSNLSLSFVLVLTLVATASSNPTDFIKSSCGATRYPALCFQCLSSYAAKIQQSRKQLAQTAISISLTRAQSATTFVSLMSKGKGLKGREYQAVQDCVETMGDSVDRLSKSVSELGEMGRGEEEFRWHMSNVQTWVSAALTNENTCVDGFQGMNGKVKAAIKGRLVNVAQVTSNALALVNRFAERH